MTQQRVLLEGAELELFKLVLKGAAPKQWAEWLRAPLEHAAVSGSFGLVDMLLRAGANGSAGWKGCGGRTLLEAAALGGNEDVVSALLRAGCAADVNVVSEHAGRSALHQAIVGRHGAVARKLMLAGADIHREDPIDGGFPLHAVISGGQGDLVSDLLIGGANPNAQDLSGRTALHVATELGHENIVTTVLATSSTNLDVVDHDGFSSLVVEGKEGHVSIAKLFWPQGLTAALVNSTIAPRCLIWRRDTATPRWSTPLWITGPT